MAKIAMLLPDSNMLSPALDAARLYQLDLSLLSVIDRTNFDDLLKHVINSETDIIIARGGQASSIQSKCPLPVVEIKITTFELSRLLQQAKALSPKELPQIALTGPRNMFVHINEALLSQLYQIRLKTYLFEHPEDMTVSAQTAISEGADVVIGGSAVYAYCKQHDIPALRTFSGEESILEACRTADILSRALDSAKIHAASLNMLLNRIPSGIIQIDENGLVCHINQFVEHLLGADYTELKGRPVKQLLPGIKDRFLSMALSRQKNVRSVSITINRSEFIVSISPIIVNDHSSGAIISFQEMLSMTPSSLSQSDRLKEKGFCAQHSFDSLIARSPATISLIQNARRAAKFFFPVLITGPEGTEKQLIAECIHNESLYKNRPFIRCSCSDFSLERLTSLLFTDSETGTRRSDPLPCTLYFSDVSCLSPDDQQKLFFFIQRYGSECSYGSGVSADQQKLRILSSTSQDLLKLAGSGSFRMDLYYALTAVQLTVLPLCMRKEDIMGWFDYYLQALQKKYSRYVKLTKDAQAFLLSYSWPGNLPELRSVCNRVFASSEKYCINSSDLKLQLSGGRLPGGENSELAHPASEPGEREQILLALRRHSGNRTAAAKDLGISTTTLWRRMKAYQLAGKS